MPDWVGRGIVRLNSEGDPGNRTDGGSGRINRLHNVNPVIGSTRRNRLTSDLVRAVIEPDLKVAKGARLADGRYSINEDVHRNVCVFGGIVAELGIITIAIAKGSEPCELIAGGKSRFEQKRPGI